MFGAAPGCVLISATNRRSRTTDLAGRAGRSTYRVCRSRRSGIPCRRMIERTRRPEPRRKSHVSRAASKMLSVRASISASSSGLLRSGASRVRLPPDEGLGHRSEAQNCLLRLGVFIAPAARRHQSGPASCSSRIEVSPGQQGVGCATISPRCQDLAVFGDSSTWRRCRRRAGSSHPSARAEASTLRTTASISARNTQRPIGTHLLDQRSAGRRSSSARRCSLVAPRQSLLVRAARSRRSALRRPSASTPYSTVLDQTLRSGSALAEVRRSRSGRRSSAACRVGSPALPRRLSTHAVVAVLRHRPQVSAPGQCRHGRLRAEVVAEGTKRTLLGHHRADTKREPISPVDHIPRPDPPVPVVLGTPLRLDLRHRSANSCDFYPPRTTQAVCHISLWSGHTLDYNASDGVVVVLDLGSALSAASAATSSLHRLGVVPQISAGPVAAHLSIDAVHVHVLLTDFIERPLVGARFASARHRRRPAPLRDAREVGCVASQRDSRGHQRDVAGHTLPHPR